MNDVAKKIIKVVAIVGSGIGAYKLGGIVREYTAKKDIQKFQKAFNKEIEKIENQKSELKKKYNAIFEDFADGDSDKSTIDYAVESKYLKEQIIRLTSKIDTLKQVRDANVEIN